MSETQKEQVSRLKSALFNANNNTVLKALAEIANEGSREMVSPLLELLISNEDETVQLEVLKQLSQLKISDIENLFIDKLRDDDYSAFHQQLVACMWSSGMNPTDDLHVLSELAVKGDYMTTLEVLTLIENMEGPFDHDSLVDAFHEVSIYVNESSPEDPKLGLIQSIYDLLYAFQQVD